jgi:hypothetical protein
MGFFSWFITWKSCGLPHNRPQSQAHSVQAWASHIRVDTLNEIHLSTRNGVVMRSVSSFSVTQSTYELLPSPKILSRVLRYGILSWATRSQPNSPEYCINVRLKIISSIYINICTRQKYKYLQVKPNLGRRQYKGIYDINISVSHVQIQ